MTWIADETHEVEIASYDNQNLEFDGVYTYRAIAGCGLPPNTCLDIPEIRKGFASVRSICDSSWSYIEDHRGDTVYSVDDGSEQSVKELGPYKINVTTLKPTTKHDRWNGVSWVTDIESQKKEYVSIADFEKSNLQYEAEMLIKPLERAKSLGIATQSELSMLVELEKYSVNLMRVDTSFAPSIEWPQKPQ